MRMVVVAIVLAASFNVFAAEEMSVTLKPDPNASLQQTQAAPAEAPAEKQPEIDCKSLNADLRAMREAQSFMLNSMIRKNSSLAETLDLFAKDFSAKKGKLQKIDFQKLKKSAEAFRGHADRERGLVTRFESSADDLVLRVQKCLDASPIASQTSEQRSQN